MARLEQGMTATSSPSLLDAAAAWYSRLRAESVDDADRCEFERWMDATPAHRLAYADICAAGLALEQSGDAADLLVRTGVPVPVRSPLRSNAWSRSRWLGVAASVLLLIGIVPGVLVLEDRWHDWTSDVHSGTGEVRELTLPDGSRLWLAPVTALDVRVDEMARRIDVKRGQVYAHVAPDAARPFDIVAGSVVARALGTRYAVALVGEGVDVAVEEGRVVVRAPGVADTIEVRTSQGVHIAVTEHTAQRGAASAATFAWRDDLLVLEDATLTQALARLDAYLPQRIVWMGTAADGKARVTAAIPAGDASHALDAIVAEHGLSRYDWIGVATVIR